MEVLECKNHDSKAQTLNIILYSYPRNIKIFKRGSYGLHGQSKRNILHETSYNSDRTSQNRAVTSKMGHKHKGEIDRYKIWFVSKLNMNTHVTSNLTLSDCNNKCPESYQDGKGRMFFLVLSLTQNILTALYSMLRKRNLRGALIQQIIIECQVTFLMLGIHIV